MTDFKLAGIFSAVGLGLGYLLGGRSSKVMEAVQGDYAITYLESHNDVENQHKYYLLLTSGNDNYTAYGRLPGYGKYRGTMKLDKQPSASKMKELAMKKMKTYQLVGHKYDQIPSELRAELERKIGIKSSSPSAEPKQEEKNPSAGMNARQRIFMKRRGLKKNAETFEANAFAGRWKDGSLRLIDEDADDYAVIQFFVRKNNADSYDVVLNDTIINDERLKPMKDSSLGDSYWIIGKIRRDRRGWKIIVPVLSENTITWQNDPYHSEGHRMLESHTENLYRAVDSIMWWFREDDGGLDFYNWVKSSSEAETFEAEEVNRETRKLLKGMAKKLYDDYGDGWYTSEGERFNFYNNKDGESVTFSFSLDEWVIDEEIDWDKFNEVANWEDYMDTSSMEEFVKEMGEEDKIDAELYIYDGIDWEKRWQVNCEITINKTKNAAETFEADMSVGNEMLRQLGGRRFMMMVGAKQPIWDSDKNELHMKIGRNAIGANYFVIRLNPRDLYDLRFESRRMNRKTYEMSVKVKAEYDDVYADQLQDIFEQATGLYVRMAESFEAEYQPDQEIVDYSVSEIAKSSAIEGYQPNKYSFGPISLGAESISSLKLKKESCCCGATKKTPCVCMILGSDCSAKKPMCACYGLKAIQEKDRKGAESSDSVPKPNPVDKGKVYEWIFKEHPHIKTDADREMEGVDYAALTYHPEELEAGAINSLKAGDFEAAERFVKALNRQNFINQFQAEENR